MPLDVDVRFVYMVSPLLRNFKQKSDYLWNFSCPFCGDSEQRQSKARAYIFRDPKTLDRLKLKCHNCGISSSISYFLNTLDKTLAKEYAFESFLYHPERDNRTTKHHSSVSANELIDREKFKTAIVSVRPEQLHGCHSIASLPDSHPARQYILNRKIPVRFHRELFWTDDFAAIAEIISPDHGMILKKNDGRILILLMNEQGVLLGVQGRSLSKHGLRYITIKTKPEYARTYGLHRLSHNPERVYCVEGPFDSMFLENAIAMVGSDIPKSLALTACTIVYDNEPRSHAICTKIENAIDKGHTVTIWPTHIGLKEFAHKDINDMILAGFSADDIVSIIDLNSYTGMNAKWQLKEWRKDIRSEHL